MSERDNAYSISIDEIYEGVTVFRYLGEDADTAHLEYANNALCEMLNFRREDFKGLSYESLLSYVFNEDRELVRSMILGLEENRTSRVIFRFKLFNSKRFVWLAVSGRILEDKKGKVAYFTCFDITAQQEATEREKRLSECLRLLTSDENWEDTLEEVMHIVHEQYCSERVYIFEFEWDKNIMHNTHEYCAENVTCEKNNLQNLPVDVVQHWIPKFRIGEAVFIDNLEDIKNIPERKDEYEVLQPQGIISLMTIPIIKNGILYGYIGVDNPEVHGRDRSFLNSIAYILSQEYFNREQQAKLVDMSLHDSLSRLNNRHSFNIRIDKIVNTDIKNVGIVFADVNGLKYVNDTFGHIEGDRVICNAADILVTYYGKSNVYRISGDEFVVILTDISNEKFAEQIKTFEADLADSYGSVVSIGYVWENNVNDIIKLINIAEDRMYAKKETYYSQNVYKRRKKYIEE